MSFPQELLREWLAYEPSTGIFLWRKKPSKHIHAGAKAGTTNGEGYVRIVLLGKNLPAHRLAWCYVNGAYPVGFEIDHRDGNRANNSIDNLRLATRSQQRQNSRVNSSSISGLKGVKYRPRVKVKKWQATIQVEGKRRSLGYFLTAEEAHAAYCHAANINFGEFARTK